MRKQEIDYILGRMLDSHNNVSYLNITVGKPFQVESSGQLAGIEMDPPVVKLTPSPQKGHLQSAGDGERLRHLRERAARCTATSSEGDPRRRDAGPGDGGDRSFRRGDRPSGLERPPYGRCRPDNQPHPRHVHHGRGEPGPGPPGRHGPLDRLPASPSQGGGGALQPSRSWGRTSV